MGYSTNKGGGSAAPDCEETAPRAHDRSRNHGAEPQTCRGRGEGRGLGRGGAGGGRGLLVRAPGAGSRHVWTQERTRLEKMQKGGRQNHVRAGSGGAGQWTFCPKAEERQRGGARSGSPVRTVIPTAGVCGQQGKALPQGTGPPAPGTAPGAPIPPAESPVGPGAVEAAGCVALEGTRRP